jgi:5-methylcytosine-specific restriction protein A
MFRTAGAGIKRGDRMPKKPKSPCNHPGCPELTAERFCEQHRKEYIKFNDRHRESAHKRGYNGRWQKARMSFLKRNPLCVHCRRTTPATVVDHIRPHRGDKSLFWDVDNWQPLCEHHHNIKTGQGQ